jgi:hypothetical protein
MRGMSVTEFDALSHSSTNGSRTAAIVGCVLGGILGLLLLALLVPLVVCLMRRKTSDPGAEQGKGGSPYGTGSGVPALGVPILVQIERDGNVAGTGGKAPPSPIKGLTEVRLPVGFS